MSSFFSLRIFDKKITTLLLFISCFFIPKQSSAELSMEAIDKLESCNKTSCCGAILDALSQLDQYILKIDTALKHLEKKMNEKKDDADAVVKAASTMKTIMTRKQLSETNITVLRNKTGKLCKK